MRRAVLQRRSTKQMMEAATASPGRRASEERRHASSKGRRTQAQAQAERMPPAAFGALPLPVCAAASPSGTTRPLYLPGHVSPAVHVALA